MLRTLLLLMGPLPELGGSDSLGTFANEVSGLVDANADALVNMGNFVLSVSALYLLSFFGSAVAYNIHRANRRTHASDRSPKRRSTKRENRC